MASAVCLIFASSIFTSNAFQLFHPIGGVGANNLLLLCPIDEMDIVINNTQLNTLKIKDVLRMVSIEKLIEKFCCACLNAQVSMPFS